MVKINAAVHCRQKLPMLAFLPFSFLGKKRRKKAAVRLTQRVRFSISACGTETHSVFSVWFGWWIQGNGCSSSEPITLRRNEAGVRKAMYAMGKKELAAVQYIQN